MFETDKALLVVSENEPSIELEKSTKTALEQLGLSKRFELTNKAGMVEYSDLVELSGVSNFKLKACFLRIQNPNLLRAMTYYSAVLFVEQDDLSLQPTGHIDFIQRHDQFNKSAEISESIIDSRQRWIEESIDELPDYLKSFTQRFQQDGSAASAMILTGELKGKGFGTLLWSLGNALLEQQGIKAVEIKDDITIGTNGLGFYDRQGAQRHKGFKKVRKLILGQGVQEVTQEVERKYALTALNSEQELKLSEAFDIQTE